MSAFNDYKGFTRSQMEWISSDRKRIMLQVIYYRVYKRVPILQLESGRCVVFDRNNLMHTTLLGMGKAVLDNRLIQEIREAWFIGPHRVGDRPCQAPYGMFPLVPFWGYRRITSYNVCYTKLLRDDTWAAARQADGRRQALGRVTPI